MSAARISQILTAVQAYRAAHGSLPATATAWDHARSGDRRYPCWATITRAGFHSMEALADALGTSVEGVQWGRTRVLAALRAYAAEHGPIPAGSERWTRATRGDPRYPCYYHILKCWPSFEAACQAAGVACASSHARWTRDEEATLRRLAGTTTRAALAEALPRHTEMAIKRRLYDLGVSCRTAQGLWTLLRLAKEIGMDYDKVQWMARHRVIATMKVSRFVYVEVADLPDWLVVQGGAALRAAVLARRRGRVIAMVDERFRLLATVTTEAA